MKAFLKNLLVGLPLAFGAMLTLVGVSLIIRGEPDAEGAAFLLAMIGIPLLFATLTAIMKE